MGLVRPTSWGQTKPSVGWGINPSAASELGLLAAYLLNEDGGGLSFDNTNNIVPGVFASVFPPVYVSGLFGSALSMAATTGVSLGASSLLDPTYPKSYAAWFLSTNVSVSQFWYSSDDSWDANLRVSLGIDSGLFVARTGGTGGSLNVLSGGTPVNNVWYHYALCLPTSTSGTLYINGVPVVTSTSMTWFGPVSGAIKTLGAVTGVIQGTFLSSLIGLLDNALFANIAWTPDQVGRLYTEPFYYMQPQSRKLWFNFSSSTHPWWEYSNSMLGSLGIEA